MPPPDQATTKWNCCSRELHWHVPVGRTKIMRPRQDSASSALVLLVLLQIKILFCRPAHSRPDTKDHTPLPVFKPMSRQMPCKLLVRM